MHVKHLGQCQIHSNQPWLGALKQRDRMGEEKRGEERRRKRKREERRGERREKQEFKVFKRRNLPGLLSATQGKSDWTSQFSESWHQGTYSLFWRWSSCLLSLKPLNIGIQWLKLLLIPFSLSNLLFIIWFSSEPGRCCSPNVSTCVSA